MICNMTILIVCVCQTLLLFLIIAFFWFLTWKLFLQHHWFFIEFFDLDKLNRKS